MPMTTTHALVPFAVAVAVARRPVPWKLILVAAFASAVPDVDGLFKHFLGIMPGSIYSHRGATHSLFVALASGLVAANCHKLLGVRPLVAGVLIALAMASHGILDMMTNSGDPVAYLWPVSSMRVFADWRPISSGVVTTHHFLSSVLPRLAADFRQLIIPMFAAALVVRFCLTMRAANSRRASAADF